jgi:hypothetical protein
MGKSDSEGIAGSGAGAYVLVAGWRRLENSFLLREMFKMGGPDVVPAATASCSFLPLDNGG